MVLKGGKGVFVHLLAKISGYDFILGIGVLVVCMILFLILQTEKG